MRGRHRCFNGCGIKRVSVLDPETWCRGDPLAVAVRTNHNGPTSDPQPWSRSEEHTSELQSLMRISYAVFCLKKKKKKIHTMVMTNTHRLTNITDAKKQYNHMLT